MNVFGISYDLYHKSRSDYEKIYSKLKKYEYVERIQQSVWIVKTVKDIDIVSQDFRSCIHNEDRLAVFVVNDELLKIFKK